MCVLSVIVTTLNLTSFQLFLQGSVYQKVRPQIEIKPDVKQNFWEASEVSEVLKNIICLLIAYYGHHVLSYFFSVRCLKNCSKIYF